MLSASSPTVAHEDDGDSSDDLSLAMMLDPPATVRAPLRRKKRTAKPWRPGLGFPICKAYMEGRWYWMWQGNWQCEKGLGLGCPVARSRAPDLRTSVKAIVRGWVSFPCPPR